jgi:hypothetical protein
MNYLPRCALATTVALALVAIAGTSVASATTFAVAGTRVNASVGYEMTIEAGSSAILKDEFGTTVDVCTASTVKGKTENVFSAATIGGAVSTLTFGACTHTTTVIAKGNLSFTWTSGLDGTVSSSNAEVTVQSTFFGASAVCKTGGGTKVGTFTGATTPGNIFSHAVVHINAKINCGILGNSSWTGKYIVTSPTELMIVS